MSLQNKKPVKTVAGDWPVDQWPRVTAACRSLSLFPPLFPHHLTVIKTAQRVSDGAKGDYSWSNSRLQTRGHALRPPPHFAPRCRVYDCVNLLPLDRGREKKGMKRDELCVLFSAIGLLRLRNKKMKYHVSIYHIKKMANILNLMRFFNHLIYLFVS